MSKNLLKRKRNLFDFLKKCSKKKLKRKALLRSRDDPHIGDEDSFQIFEAFSEYRNFTRGCGIYDITS